MKKSALAIVLAVGVVAFVIVLAACHGNAEFPAAHRETAAVCPADPKLAVNSESVPPPAAGSENCSADGDCTKGNHGRCLTGGHRASHCSYDDCMSDGDCSAGTTCACARDGNHCVASNCRTDAQCGGRGCSPTEARSCNDYGGVSGYYCHTKKDSCTDSSDCGGRGYCEYSPEAARWVCVDHGRCVG